MIINQLTLEEVDKHKRSIVSMLRQSFIKSFPDEKNDINSFEQRIESLKRYLNNDKAIILGIIDREKLMGFIWFFEKEDYSIHVNHFVVDEKYRGLGIGRALWNKVEEYANKRQISEIELFVTKENEAALNFYTNREFKVERLVMKKRL